MFLDPMYYLFALPALILGLYAQYRVRSAYGKWSQVRNGRNITGVEAADRLLATGSLGDLRVQETPGQLSDHYDPRNKTLNLSSDVARAPSVAALGIVAHEVGHAAQDRDGYAPMKVRSGLVPIVQIGSWIGPILFIIGLLIASTRLAGAGLILFSATLVFSLVTLPVELNASSRAVVMLRDAGLVTSPDEEQGVRAVLSAAALTYVAAAAQSLANILYFLTLLSGSRRR